MKICWSKYPLLQNCTKNILVDPRRTISFNEWDLFRKDIEKELQLYKGKNIQISYITSDVHKKLRDTNHFIVEKHLLKEVPESFGYIILPEKFKPLEVSETMDLDLEDFYYDSVLFSFIKQETHDLNVFGRLDDSSMLDEEEKEEYLNSKWLTILPVQNGKIKYCVRDAISSVDEEFGNIHGSESWDAYSNMLDYVFSFLIYSRFMESDRKIISGMNNGKINNLIYANEKYLNETFNDIVIV